MPVADTAGQTHQFSGLRRCGARVRLFNKLQPKQTTYRGGRQISTCVRSISSGVLHANGLEAGCACRCQNSTTSLIFPQAACANSISWILPIWSEGRLYPKSVFKKHIIFDVCGCQRGDSIFMQGLMSCVLGMAQTLFFDTLYIMERMNYLRILCSHFNFI